MLRGISMENPDFGGTTIISFSNLTEVADEAAKQYLESVRQMADEGELKDE